MFSCNKSNQNTKETNSKYYKFPTVDDLAFQQYTYSLHFNFTVEFNV